MEMRRSPLLLASMLACGRSPLYAVDEDTGTSSETTIMPSTSSTTGPPPPPSCIDQGGVPTRDGGPWVIAQGLERAGVIGLGASDDALLAVWVGPFLGTDPMPDVFGVTIDHEGVLLGSPQVLWDRPLITHASMHAAAQGYVVTYCGREGASDETMSRILDITGATIGEELVRAPPGFSCGASAPDGIWTGAAYIFAWTDNAGSDYEVLLDLADADAHTTSSSILVPNGDISSPPRLAVGPSDVVMAAGIGNTQLGIWRIDRGGTTVSDPIVLDAPDEFSIGEVAVGVAADGSAWAWVVNHNDVGIRRVVVDAQGNLIVAFEELAIPEGGYDRLHAEAWPGGAVITADVATGSAEVTAWFAVDDHGELVAFEVVDDGLPAVFEAHTALAVRGAQAWVLYTAHQDDDNDDVRLYRLGCAL
jgi:hypothetical protein